MRWGATPSGATPSLSAPSVSALRSLRPTRRQGPARERRPRRSAPGALRRFLQFLTQACACLPRAWKAWWSGPEKGDGTSRMLFVQRRAGTPCPVGSVAVAIGRPDTGGRVQDLAIERLTVAQAATRLGVSQDAVRKRIKRGTIEYEQDQDGRLHVYLDPLEVYETRQDRSDDEPTERLAWAQHQEIEFLRRELETRTEEIRRQWQKRRRVRGGRLDRTARPREKLTRHARAGGNACLAAPRRHRTCRLLSGGRIPATP